MLHSMQSMPVAQGLRAVLGTPGSAIRVWLAEQSMSGQHLRGQLLHAGLLEAHKLGAPGLQVQDGTCR